jgi:aspartate/methionine/tyrosine aminotransferase
MSFADLDLTISPLEQLRRRAAARPDYIDLSSSNSTQHGFIFPPDILRQAADAYWLARRYEPHPKGSLRAREAIAQYYAGRSPALHVSPEQVFITASTSEAYALLFTLLAEPGDNVLAPQPSYPLFEHLAMMRHITLRNYQLELRTTSGGTPQWRLDQPGLAEEADEHTRAVLLISPHNPTGHVMSENIAVPRARQARGRSEGTGEGLPLIADEVFCEFPFALTSVPPVGALFPDETVFHLNGISKMFALPDLKLSWIALTGPRAGDYLERLELLNDTLLSANSLTQAMLPALFAQGMDFTRSMHARIRETLTMALERFAGMDGVRVAPPQGGTYLFPRFSACDDEEALVKRLLETGVFAHPGYFYDADDGCHLMISGLLEKEKLLAGILRVGSVLSA